MSSRDAYKLVLSYAYIQVFSLASVRAFLFALLGAGLSILLPHARFVDASISPLFSLPFAFQVFVISFGAGIVGESFHGLVWSAFRESGFCLAYDNWIDEVIYRYGLYCVDQKERHAEFRDLERIGSEVVGK